MANTITKTTILDGPKNLVILVNIVGDGSGEETNTVLVDRSAFVPTDGLELNVRRISGYQTGFTSVLSFDASTDLVFAHLPADYFDYDWCRFGGVSSNKSGTGAIGDILLTTSSLGSGDRATFVLELVKS